MRHTADSVPRGTSHDREQHDVTAGRARSWRRDVERS
jgi:hypothetical protein